MGLGRRRRDPGAMTTSGSASPSDHDDITRLAKAILDGERRPFEEQRQRLPRRHVRPEALLSLRVPSVVVQLLLACWVVYGVVAIVVGFMQRSLLHRVAGDPTSVRFADVIADQHRVDVVNGVFLVLLIATAVAFVAWFWRAYQNLDALDLPRRYETGWAIGGWFVPFLNFVRPKQVADDIWVSVNASEYGGAGEREGSLLLGAWWAAWIAASLLGLFARDNTKDSTLDQALTNNGLFIARSALFIVAAVLAMFVVRCITRAHTFAGADAERLRPQDSSSS